MIPTDHVAAIADALDVNRVTAPDDLTAEPQLAPLVTGIIEDVQTLVVQQFLAARQEIAVNLTRRAKGAAVIAAGVGLGWLAILLFCFGAVQALHASSVASLSDQSGLSLAACYAIIGIGLIVLSVGLLLLGNGMLRSLSPWQSNADELLKENRTWTNNRK